MAVIVRIVSADGSKVVTKKLPAVPSKLKVPSGAIVEVVDAHTGQKVPIDRGEARENRADDESTHAVAVEETTGWPQGRTTLDPLAQTGEFAALVAGMGAETGAGAGYSGTVALQGESSGDGGLFGGDSSLLLYGLIGVAVVAGAIVLLSDDADNGADNDLIPPAAPAGLDLAAADDTGNSNSDNLTSRTSGLTIGGTAEAGSTVELLDGTTVVGTATAGADGTFSLDISLGEGAHAITATATDAAGNTGDASAALNVTVDATAPAAASGLAYANGAVSGTAEAGSRVEVISNGTSVGTVTAGSNGAFSLAVALDPGSYTITAAATDAAGNTGTASAGLPVTIAAPTGPAQLTNTSIDGNGDILTLYFDSPLAAPEIAPAVIAFDVDQGGAVTIREAEIVGNRVILRLDEPLAADQPVTVSFSGTGIENAQAFSDVAVTNRLSTIASDAVTASMVGNILLAGAEISAFDPGSDRLFVTSGDGIQVVSVGADLTMTALGTVAVGTNDVTSVAVGNGIVAVAVVADDKTQPGKVYFLDASAGVGAGMVLGSIEVGSLPDMVTFTPDGMKVLVANEAELTEDGTDPVGSISVIDLSGGVDSATVQTASFDAFNGQLAALKAEGVRLFAGEEGFETTTVAQDLEPEYIAISPDGAQAFVTLQENNAVAVVDIATASVVDVVALGLKPFEGLPADFSDRDGGINLDRGAFNSPDAMLDGQNGFYAREIFTVGETLGNGYTPPGVMDGIGAIELDASTVRVFVNHELAATDGYAYSLANGTELTGSRISYFDIDKATMQVKDGGLAFDTVYDSSGSAITDNGFSINPGDAGMGGFERFCSAALFEADTFGAGRGLVDNIFFAGEETGGEFNAVSGAEWALDVATGELWAIPSMGRGAWENVTQVDTGTTTHVAFILADDTSPFDADGDDVDEAAPLYLYIGEKDASADAGFLARNGLEGGKLYVWVPGDAAMNDPDAFTGEGSSLAGTWVEIDNARNEASASADGSSGFDQYGYPTQANLWTQAEAAGAFQFSRPEDVATNPQNGSEFVLASTGRQSDFNGADLVGELYTMEIAFDFTLAPGLPGEPDFNEFNGATGALRILYDGDSDPLQTLRSPDNVDWADDGMIYAQEDRAVSGIFGGDAINQSEAGIVRIDPGGAGPNPVRIANIDRSAVLPDGATDDAVGDVGNWESSGILDVSALFGKPAGSLFLADVQAHGIDDQDRFTTEGEAARITDGDLKEGGQLLFVHTDAAGISAADTPVYGQFMPDAIASFEGGDGMTYYVIANEGDDRDDFLPGFLDGFEEAMRVKDLDLDPVAFPDAALLQRNEALGRLNVSGAPGSDGDTDGDGDIDKLLAYGARSFSILDANGQIVFDSGSHIEQFMALGGLYDEDSNTGLLDEGRSDNKGPEPEGVTIGHFGGAVLAFIAIERGGGGVMVYDVTDPSAVEFVQYLRDLRDISPEGLAYVKAEDSPTGKPVLFVSNEETGTVSAYELTAGKDDTAYLVGIGGRASFEAIISAPESATDGYVFDGTPDGMGVIDLGDGTSRVLVNHEFGDGKGIVRAHGSNGSYVSDLIIDNATLEVISGQDFLQSVDDLFLNNNGSGWTSGATTVFNRLCSGDLADLTAFFANGTGYDGRIYLTGEEAGAEGRAFAHILTGEEAGTVYELPALGNMSFENVVANPFEGGKTIVAGLDDTSNQGQVYFYVGDKQLTGNAVEMAGLSGGQLFAVKVGEAGQDEVGSLADPAQTGFGLIGGEAAFSLVALGDVSSETGADINDASVLAGASNFLRPEDGAWSLDGSTFYFVTTASTSSASRLWALEFDDAGNPVAGGTAKLLLDGSEGQIMFDNMTVSDSGRIIIQEDPGSSDRLAKIWSYDPDTDELTAIGEHNPRLFSPESPDLITTNEESSGVIDVTMLFAGQAGYSADMAYFLIADQVHADLETPASAVEYGQLTLMSVVAEFG